MASALDPRLVAENVVQTMTVFGTNFEDTWEFHVSENMRSGQNVEVIRNLVSEMLRNSGV